jgi:apolipoprotein N-acyltransferase
VLRSPGATTARAALVTAAGTLITGVALAVYVRVAWPSIAIAWFCLVPWLLALDRTRSMRGALGAGILMSLGFVVAAFTWFPAAIEDYTGASWPAAVALTLVLAPALEPQFVALALARHLARRAPRGARWWRTAVVGAGAYVGTEWAWPKLLADTLGHPLYASAHLRQAADLAGAHGLTFALVVANECVVAVLRAFHDRRHPGSVPTRSSTRSVAEPASCFVLLVAGLTAYGGLRLAQLERHHAGDRIEVATVQANIAQYDRLRAEVGTFEAVRRILEAHFALSGEALGRERLDMLVWPETVYPTTFGSPKSAEGADFDRAITAFVADRRVPLLLGAYAAEGAKEFNAAVLLQPGLDGRVVSETYRKTRLFPFTERLPWPFDSDRVRRWMPWAGTWTPGTGPRVLAVEMPGRRPLRIAPLICYDAVDPAFGVAAARQGAELLVTLSNDSWFAYPGVQRLILIVSAFRSIETRLPQLRSTPTGMSALIDETGALLQAIDAGKRGVLVGRLQPAHRPWTLMLAWGNWLPPAAAAGSLVLLLAGYRRRSAGAR